MESTMTMLTMMMTNLRGMTVGMMTTLMSTLTVVLPAAVEDWMTKTTTCFCRMVMMMMMMECNMNNTFLLHQRNRWVLLILPELNTVKKTMITTTMILRVREMTSIQCHYDEG